MTLRRLLQGSRALFKLCRAISSSSLITSLSQSTIEGLRLLQQMLRWRMLQVCCSSSALQDAHSSCVMLDCTGHCFNS